MNARWLFVAVTAFWVVMNVLLWRSEMRGSAASNVPLDKVAQRMLEAADSSTLLIRQRGQPMGQMRWTPSVLQDDASATNQLADEGMVTRRTGYAIDLDVNLTGVSGGLRGRAMGRFVLNPDRSWRSLEFRFTQKNLTYAITTQADEAQVHLRVEQDREVVLDQTLPLQNPAALLTRLDGTLGGFGLLSPGMLSGLGLFAGMGGTNATSANLPPDLLRWESHTAEMQISQQRIRTYQITGRWLNRYQGDLWIGRGGELLRIVLPNDIELRDPNLPAER